MPRGSRCTLRPGLAVSATVLLTTAAALAAPSGLSVSQPWIRALVPGSPAAGYFTLSNSGDRQAVLDAASSPDCKQLMLHRSVTAGSMARMQMVPSVLVPAHGSVSFAPGGYHLMCMQPAASVKAGATVPVTLRFEDGSALTQDFPVRGAKGE